MSRLHLTNVLLDRDGTIIEERHYLRDPDGVALVAGGGEALGRLTRAGLRLFCVTNQSGIGRGYYDETDFQAVQQRLMHLLAPFGATITATAFCPHAPDAGCDCRKPGVGLFTHLDGAHDLDPSQSAVIGDAASDIAFGLAIGSPLTIQVLTGHGQRDAERLGLPRLTGSSLLLTDRRDGWPHVLARDLAAAADVVLAATRD